MAVVTLWTDSGWPDLVLGCFIILLALHAAFWDEGYRAVMLTDTANFRNPHYHQPTDTLDTLDLEFLEGVAEIVAGCIEDLAGASRPWWDSAIQAQMANPKPVPFFVCDLASSVR